MLSIIKKTALSGTIALTALAAVPAAQADNLYLGVEGGRVGVGFDDGYRDRDRDRDGGRSGFYRDRDDDRDYRRRDFGPRCSPDRALFKAERMGIHNARIRFVGPRVIGVAGRSRGHRTEVTFGRAPSCPVIG